MSKQGIRKYKKRPIQVEALQICKGNHSDIINFVEDYCEIDVIKMNVTIGTLEGKMKGYLGDYIIKGIKGEFYICRKDIFEESYVECV